LPLHVDQKCNKDQREVRYEGMREEEEEIELIWTGYL